MRLIKINTEHYIVVDKTQQPVKGFYYDNFINAIRTTNNAEYGEADHCQQITHSTHPMQGVFPIPITEVKELIGEVDVEKKAHNWFMTEKFMSSHIADMKSFIAGYNQALEDNKEKKYTEEDLRKAFFNGGNMKEIEEFNSFIQSLQPKTEWEVEFDENGKLKLV